jgi:hypothetical protein
MEDSEELCLVPSLVAWKGDAEELCFVWLGRETQRSCAWCHPWLCGRATRNSEKLCLLVPFLVAWKGDAQELCFVPSLVAWKGDAEELCLVVPALVSEKGDS